VYLLYYTKNGSPLGEACPKFSRSRGHEDCHKAKHHKHNKVKKMLNVQSSFSAHSFSLKPVEESSNAATWSSNDPSPQSFSSSSLQDPVAELSSLHTPIVNGSTSNPASGLISYPNNRTAEDLHIIRETAEGYVSKIHKMAFTHAPDSFASCLAADHAAVLNPDVDSPFIDAVDVVHRLLPYHVFQQPQEDLRTVTERRRAKGKGKAHDVILDEIEGRKTLFLISR